MEIYIDDASGLWKPLQADNTTAFSLRKEILERFIKAEGHINATDRKIWNETDRGLWSAYQAIARIS